MDENIVPLRFFFISRLSLQSRTKTEGDPTSKNGETTVDGGNQGPAMPWEQSAQMQGYVGLLY